MRIYAFSAIAAFLLSACFCRLLLPVLKKLKAGQNILCYVKEHEKKKGTPTMGGLSFIFAVLISVAVFARKCDRATIVALSLFLAFAAVGFLDDVTKIKRRDNLGLKPYQKIIFQSVASVLAGIYCYRSGKISLHMPFSGKNVGIGVWIVPLVAFAFLALVNAVNLTDGLDGLAGGSCAAYFFFFGILILAQAAKENGGAISEDQPLALTCFCVAAALFGFLLFNVPPASVFMGDTGSLALGGLAAAVAAFSGNALYIPLIGITFVVSVITVIMQVIYYKATKGKRIFLMAPIHHHFQKKGCSESKISFAYAAVTALAGIVALAFFR